MTRAHYSAILLLAVLACSEDPTEPSQLTQPTPVASVSMSPTTSSLAPAQTVQLTAIALDAAGAALTSRTISWSSSAVAVATVNAGLVTAVAPGTAIITATSEGRSGTATITVQAPLAPVASVSIDPPTSSVVPTQTVQLTATPRDAAGAALTDRIITWSSSDVAVATVSAGLVTAVAPGTVTITATSEGQSGTGTITVALGTLVGPAGGTVVAANGAVQLEVPAGALASSKGIIVTERPVPLPEPAGQWLVGGPIWDIGPDGTVFAQPVTVTLAYDPARLPPWVQAEDLILQHWNGTLWEPLTDVMVDPVARTVSGKTTHFSAFGTATVLPQVTVTPNSGSVNIIQRSVLLIADVVGPPLDQQYRFSYQWNSTGQNGDINWTGGTGAQYTATMPVLPQGGALVDKVTVTVMAVRINGTGSPEPVGTVTVDIMGDLEFVTELTPWSSKIDFEESQDLQVVVRDNQGNQIPLVDGGGVKYFFEWSETGNAGNIPPPLNTQTSNKMVTYTTKPTSQQAPSPPRGDRINVVVIKESLVKDPQSQSPYVTYIKRTEELGRAEAFVEVAGEIHLGRFDVEVTPASGVNRSCVNAYWYAPKVTGATLYDLRGYNYNDPAFWGTEFTRQWSGPVADTGGKNTAIEDLGSEWRGGLSGVCGPNQNAASYEAGLRARFAGMIVEVVVTM